VQWYKAVTVVEKDKCGCRNQFCQLLNGCGANDVRQTEMLMAEPLVSEPSAFEVEMAVEKLKKTTHHQVLIKFQQNCLQQEVGKFIMRSINLVIDCIWNKEELPEQWKESIIVSIYRKGDKTYCSN
jgi:hypothetical protein